MNFDRYSAKERLLQFWLIFELIFAFHIKIKEKNTFIIPSRVQTMKFILSSSFRLQRTLMLGI